MLCIHTLIAFGLCFGTSLVDFALRKFLDFSPTPVHIIAS